MTDTFGFTAAATNTTLRGGYVVGAGGEYAFSLNWSAKTEYQYIDLGRVFISLANLSEQLHRSSTFSITLDMTITRCRLD